MCKSGRISAVLVFVFCFTLTSSAEQPRWEDRVLPLPQEMEIEGSFRVKAGDIGYRIEAGEEAPVFKTARHLLDSFAMAGEGPGGGLNIELVLLEENPGAVPGELAGRLATTLNAGQAYAVTVKEGSPPGLTLAASTPVGLLYAARTLTQLVKAGEGLTANTMLEIPLAEIVDWPDIAQRGEWSHTGYADMGWNSQWKLNMYKMLVTHWRKEFSLCCLSSTAKEPFFEWAGEVGYTLIPFIDHLGRMAESGWKGISPPVFTDENPRPGRIRGYCWSDGGIMEILSEWMRESVENSKISPDGKQDIEVWLTEGGGTACYCSGCGGENVHVLETKGIIRAYNKIKKEYPDVRLRIGLTQGSYPKNDKIIKLVKPHGIGVVYYHGHYTYRTDREPIIYSALEEYSRGGGLADVIPQITPCWNALVPGSMAQFVRFRAEEFADKKLTAVSAYNRGGQFHYELNHAAWGEYTWNSRGRPERDFARAYATITGIAEPELFSRWAVKAGEAAWELATSMYMFYLGRANYTLLPAAAEDNEPQKLSTIRLDRAMRNAREAVILAREAGNQLMLTESEFTLAALKSIKLRMQTQDLLQELIRGRATREEVGEKLEELDICAHIVRSTIYEWNWTGVEKKLALRNKPGYLSPPDVPGARWRYLRGVGSYRFPLGRKLEPAHGVLRASDVDRQNASMFGVPDTRGELAPSEIADWTEADFRGGSLRVNQDISSTAALSGGWYNLGLNFLEGSPLMISSITLTSVNTDTGARKILSSDEPRRNLSSASAHASIFDHLLRAPERRKNEELFLEIEFTGDGAGSAGYITLRRVYSRDELPRGWIDRILE